MELSTDFISRFLAFEDGGLTGDWDWASEYGEPGYGGFGETITQVILGYYWCKCGKNPHTGQPKHRYSGDPEQLVEAGDLHSFDSHYPRIWAAIESQGYQFEWGDEWTVVNDKAYRTEADSYSWRPSAIYDDDSCEYLTDDDDIETWIEWCADDGSRCLPSNIYSVSDLEATGFESYNGIYENGWHPGQTDDPKKITEVIRREYPDHTIVFVLDESSQFYIRFTAYIRPPQEDDE